MTVRLSVVVPVYRNESTLEELHVRLSSTLSILALSDYELIFVDDGSPDQSWNVIERLVSVDPRVVGLRLDSNVGQVRALCAGFSIAGGDVVVTMDADLEHPPEAIPDLLGAFRDGHDLVIGRRIGHSATKARAVGSRVINLVARLVRLPPTGVGSSFIMGTPRVAAEMQRLVHQTGRQLLLPTMFEFAAAPAVVEVELSTEAPSAYTFGGAARLGGEFLISELAPRIARRLLVASGVLVALSTVAPAPAQAAKAQRLGVVLGWLGVVGLLASRASRQQRPADRCRIADRIGGGLRPPDRPSLRTDP